MDFFTTRRRNANPDELLQGQLEIADSERRLQRELAEGIRGVALEDVRTEVARDLGIGENPESLDMNPQQFSIATSPDQSGLREEAEREARTSIVPSREGQEVRSEKEAEGRRSEVVRSSGPIGPPVSYGPEVAQVKREEEEKCERREAAGGTEGSFRPLFDEEQLVRLQQLQGQASWVYGQQRGFGFAPPVARPLFLEREEEVRAVMELEKKIEEKFEEQREKERGELSKLVKALETVVGENQLLKDRLKRLEEREEVGSTFMTPESQRERKEEIYKSVEESLKDRIEEVVKIEGRGGEGAAKVEERSKGDKTEERREEKTAFQVMLKLMEGMQAMQKQWLEDREGGSGSEAVRGSHQLPSLPDWSATTGPIDLNDWLALIEPMMSDLTNSSGLWWKQLMSEAMDWYLKHLQLQPLERIHHEPMPSEELEKAKWSRLERRASTMLLMAIPEGQREELISSKKLTALKIICYLLTVYQPGGLAEKELILRQLESPTEATSLGDAVQALRRWSRWRRRAGELGVLEPDPFLLLKGLTKIIRKPLEANRDLNFRVSLARSTLQVDATPTSKSVTSFAMHLLAEFEQVAHQDGGSRRKADAEKAKELRLKKVEEEGYKGGGKGKEKGGDQEREAIKCRFFLTDTGCRKGRDCTFSHEQRDEKRRCWACGAVDHFSNACPRGKGRSSFEGSPPKQKAVKTEAEEEAQKNKEAGRMREGEEEDKDSTASMKDLLEEANKMLKTLTGPSSTSSTRTERTEAEERNQVVERLQEQLNSLKQNNMKQKTFKLSRMVKGKEQGLIDSGATNPLRSKKVEEKEEGYSPVSVTLADGGHIQLKMTPGGVMITEKDDVEPIVPMGHLVKTLRCSVNWEEGGLKVVHPVRGRLPVKCCDGCPQVPRKLALELIDEIEKVRTGARLKKLDLQGEFEWMKELVETHPVLKNLPKKVREGLVVEPGEWKNLPGNHRLRKKLKKEGVVVHLFAGEEDGFTLSRALKQQGGDPSKLVEIDIKRGKEQDMLSPGGVYNSLVRIALEGKLSALVGGPNCRSRSVLRHYPIEGAEWYPRPVRSWGGGENGIEGLTEAEERMIYEDDLMLWRMIFLYMISTYVKRARGQKEKTWFSLEQPASPSSYKPEVVSLWDTDGWKEIKKEFNLEETTFNQGDLGGDAVKPTTFGGSLELKIDEHEKKRKGKVKEVRDSKKLARWSPGLMNMVAQALLEQVFEKEVQMKALSWEEHLAFNHVPYRRDCLICQETQQKGHPHRKVQHVSGGVLSLDTSGPLVAANDAGGFKAKYMLVGVLTWAVPKGARGLEEPVEEEDVEGAPEIDLPGVPELEDEEAGEHAGGEQRVEVERVEEEEGREEEGERGKQEFEVRKFRMASPMITKRAEEVTKVVMEFILKLRMDGYYVNRIHTDLGHEFMGYFKKWTQQRGIALTRTPGDDPQSNGRAEVAVQSLKTQVRRTLRSAGVGSEWWPWALRYVNEMNRAYRTDRRPDWPSFLQEVLVRKRTWRQGELDTTVDRVKYLSPAPEEHGHWIVKEGETPRITKYIMKKAMEPVTEGTWLALERELVDAISIRRRLRGKTTVRRMEVADHQGEPLRKNKMRSLRIIEEEEMRIEEEGGKTYRLLQLQSEPNLWKILEERVMKDEEAEMSGLLMTYVDDLFVVGRTSLVSATLNSIRSTWRTSSPEWVSEKAIKFLGMDVKKGKNEEGEMEWMITQESYLKDLLSKGGTEEIKKRKIPITRDQTAMLAGRNEKPTAEDIKLSQKLVGELLWVVTRSRPDVMYSVSKMGSNITKNPKGVIETACQTKGYLIGKEEEGIGFKKIEGDELLLECYSDSSFAPEGEESHGCYIILLGGSPIFWRSGKQGVVTLSTAETELMEMVEGMAAGEAVVVIAQEVFKSVRKILWSDSQSAISILTTEGGNWRTRHLKMRSSYARQAVMRGEWSVGHKPGEIMIADIGTKPLSSARIDRLKKLMNMKNFGKNEDEEKDKATEAEEQKAEDAEAEKKEGGGKIDVENAAKVVRLITMAAAISIAKGEKEGKKEEAAEELYYFMVFYTVLVVAISLGLQAIWKIGVRTLRSGFEEGRYLFGFRRLPNEPEEEPEDPPMEESVEDQGDETRHQREEVQRQEEEEENQEALEESQREEERGRTEAAAPMSLEDEWNEILREEEQIRREVRMGLPHVMGNTETENEEPRPLEDLPFRVFRTKYGKVYHTSQDCKHLTSKNTQGHRESKWCMGCRLEAWNTGIVPTRGVRLFIGALGSEAHTRERCPGRREATGFSLCLDCTG
eukprot:symbB.v1.2.006133.t1/scaffold365.1/size219215/8